MYRWDNIVLCRIACYQFVVGCIMKLQMIKECNNISEENISSPIHPDNFLKGGCRVFL